MSKDNRNIAWNQFRGELPCVDEEYLKRAFAVAWFARGQADKEAIRKLADPIWRRAIESLDYPFWEF